MDSRRESQDASLSVEDHVRAKALATDAEDLPQGYYHSMRIISTFTGMAIGLVATYFAFEASAAAIVQINADIGPSPNVSLFSTVWTVAQAIGILLMGRLTDRFGRRIFVLATNVLGLIGAIVACTAPTFNTLIGAQVLLGLAASQSGCYLLLVGEIMSNKYKFVGTVCVAFPNIVATGFGAYIGESLGIGGNWRWIFYIYIIMQVCGTSLLFLFYYPPSFVQLHGKQTSKREEIAKLDWIGIFLLVAGLTLFLLGISWGGNPSPWSSPKILGLLISGAVAIIVFVLYECFSGVERPIVPMHFFRDIRGFTVLVILAGVMGIMNVALFILYPLQIIHIFGSTLHTWEETAWMSTTAAFGIWAGILILGSFFHKVGHIRWQITFGSIWVTAFLGSMASVTRDDKTAAIVLSILTGFAVGWGEDVAMLLVQFITPDEELGVAFSIVSASRVVFGSIFTAAFQAVYMNQLPGKLQSILIPAVTSAGLPESSFSDLLTAVQTGSQEAIAAVPGMTSAILDVTNDGVADSYAASYQYVYYFAVGLGCIAIIACACSRDFDQYLNNHVPHQIYSRKEAGVDVLASEKSTPADSDVSIQAGEKQLDV